MFWHLTEADSFDLFYPFYLSDKTKYIKQFDQILSPHVY